MPCDIGYRSTAKARIETPAPQAFVSRARAPEIDEELLERLGVAEPTFIGWLEELDTTPLLEAALERALAAGQEGRAPVRFSIEGDSLVAKGTARDAGERAAVESATAAPVRRFT